MGTTWFISDHHLQHANILNFKDKHGCLIRPEFFIVEEMDEYIISSHNEVVGDNDTVYFLGDVVWKANQLARTQLNRMKGRKRLIVGNHDNIPFLTPFFERVYLWKKFKDHDFIASHVPLAHDDMARTKFNVHGHLHEKDVLAKDGTPDMRYLNVSVEQTGYMPVSLDEVVSLLEMPTWDKTTMKLVNNGQGIYTRG